MAIYTLKRKQFLPIPLDQAWDFFSAPENLKKITPEYMAFDIKSDPEFLTGIYAGQVIVYTVRPLFNVPLLWMTEITQVQKGDFFIDEQRFGPYTLWHHQHHFKAVPGGVEMTDLVHYRLPLGFLGTIAHALFVRRQLEGIFDYRRVQLEHFFN